jgi:hypothetical protein
MRRPKASPWAGIRSACQSATALVATAPPPQCEDGIPRTEVELATPGAALEIYASLLKLDGAVRCAARRASTLAVLLCCLTWAAVAEQPASIEPAAAGSQAAPSQEAAAPAPPPDSRPGLFGTIGQWIDRSIGRVSTEFWKKSEVGEASKNAVLGLLPKQDRLGI